MTSARRPAGREKQATSSLSLSLSSSVAGIARRGVAARGELQLDYALHVVAAGAR